MTIAEAREAVSGKLIFGDETQIKAKKLLEAQEEQDRIGPSIQDAVDEARAALDSIESAALKIAC